MILLLLLRTVLHTACVDAKGYVHQEAIRTTAKVYKSGIDSTFTVAMVHVTKMTAKIG